MLVILSLVAALGGACGSGVAGDCSGGRLEGDSCVSTQPHVHWTSATASEAVTRFAYSPMVDGRLTHAHCRIVKRFPGNEATAVCSAMFVAPGAAPTRARVAFSLSGIGVLNPDCSTVWKTSPYCVGRDRVATSSDSA